MKVRALRGVCVGPSVHLVPGELADVDGGTATFLVGIGAVEKVAEDPPARPAAPEPEPKPDGAKPAPKKGT